MHRRSGWPRTSTATCSAFYLYLNEDDEDTAAALEPFIDVRMFFFWCRRVYGCPRVLFFDCHC
jgi:hypothetical protein